jgi:16S rRNA (cytidine1402-2'-O)-methyltransferase
VAVVTDAGMPGVSDPGYRLVAACVEVGLPVEVVPGPSAVLSALVISGLPTDRFAFEGFLPRTGRARKDRLAALATEPRTIVLFESPKRVATTLADLLDSGGDRHAAVVRELTKLHQEVIRGRLSDLLSKLRDRDLKGEVVLVVEGQSAAVEPDLQGTVAHALRLVRSGARKRDAAKEAAGRGGVSATDVYAALVEADKMGPRSATAEATSATAEPGPR